MLIKLCKPKFDSFEALLIYSYFIELSVLAIVVVLIATLAPRQCTAQTALPEWYTNGPSGAQACIGLHIDPNGQPHWHKPLNFSCPKYTALVSVTNASGPSSRPAENIQVFGTCCPLPSSDILTEEHVDALHTCPKDHIATGGRGLCDVGENVNPANDCAKPIRCTKINTKRYILGQMSPGSYWGYGATYFKNKHRYMKSELPAAIQVALGREDKFIWATQGCVGSPAGSLLVAKRGKRCQNFFFRQLQYKGEDGDPKRGEPVKIFPNCSFPPDPFDINARCLEEK